MIENQCGAGDENDSLQSDSKVREVTQHPKGTHTSLVTNCSYLKIKSKVVFFNLIIIFFQMATKLLGHKPYYIIWT